MKQCRDKNCPLQDICRGAVDNETWWNIGEDCEIFSFVNAQADKIFTLENRLKECENGYEGTLFLDRCKLHDAEEKVKELTEENERMHASCTELTRKCASLDEDVAEAEAEAEAEKAIDIAEDNIRAEIASCGTSCHWCENKIKADIVRKMQDKIHKKAYTNNYWHEVVLLSDIDQIAKEMLKGDKDGLDKIL